MTDELKPFNGKTSYIAAWAGAGALYCVFECCDATYQRRVVAYMDELSAEQNRMLANTLAVAMNSRPLEDALRAENARLREALLPFVARAEQPKFENAPDDSPVTFFAKDVRIAKQALKETI